jgi:hypothetical protein
MLLSSRRVPVWDVLQEGAAPEAEAVVGRRVEGEGRSNAWERGRAGVGVVGPGLELGLRVGRAGEVS